MICTEFRTGKTQLSHTLCGNIGYLCGFIPNSFTTLDTATVTTQLPGSNGYCGGKVVFIDTEVCYIYVLIFYGDHPIFLSHIGNKEHLVSNIDKDANGCLG